MAALVVLILAMGLHLASPSQAYSATYGELSAQWWQWALIEPQGSNPLFTSGGNELNQNGPVWFLGGSGSTIRSLVPSLSPLIKIFFFLS